MNNKKRKKILFAILIAAVIILILLLHCCGPQEPVKEILGVQKSNGDLIRITSSILQKPYCRLLRT